MKTRISLELVLWYSTAIIGLVFVINDYAAAQVPDIVFSGTVVDLQGNARIGKDVVAEVRFQNDGSPVNALDGNDPRLASTPTYDPTTAKFFLPIREDVIPPGDVSISLRFIIDSQVISQVDWPTALKSLDLDVVVPDPVPMPKRAPVRQHRCRLRCRWR